ncbi:MAG: hypothetical protein M3Y48_16635 [Actinomycetota bacterium]|nr:hypothetical protein [Actinomycetota bacterium]
MERAALNVSPDALGNHGKKVDEVLPPVGLVGIALAWTVGFIAAGRLVITPASLGVREVALLMVLIHGQPVPR